VKGLVLAALVLATAPLYADYTPFYLGLLTEVLVFGLFALAYDVLLGHAGVLSLGHSAFLGWPPTSPASCSRAIISRSS
jgi:branched-chain amino acid transport system permease protein